MEQIPQKTDGEFLADPKRAQNNLKLLIAGVSGALAYFLLRLVSTRLVAPQSVLQPIPDGGGSVLFRLNDQILHAINSVYLVLPFFLVCVFAAVSRRNHPRAWLFAFLAGYVFPFIALHWILRWM